MKLFDKCVALAVKYRHFLILSALLATLLVVAGWVYMDNIRAAMDYTTYEWVSDSADVCSEPIDFESEFRQSFTTSDPVHGGGFVFCTYETVIYGTVTLALQDQDGNTLASTSLPAHELYDNTFQQMVFDTPVTPDGETTYDFVVTFAPNHDMLYLSPELEYYSLGIWVSDAPADSLSPYVLNGEIADTCASFAIVTNRGGSAILYAYLACVALAAAMILVGYWLVFLHKAPLHVVFIFFALTLGVLYMALIPPYVGTDEEKHIHTAYALSNTLMGIENDTSVSLRASDNVTFDKADSLDVFSYQLAITELFGQCEDSTIISTDHEIVYTEPLYLHLHTALAITLARLLGFNYITLIFFGRMMNLLVYTAITALAIYLMPRFGRMLCVVGLLPMSLQLAATFNYDALILATAFLYIALILKTRETEGDFSYKQLIPVAVLGLLLAPMKKLYVFVCLFCCILPLKRCPKQIQKWFWKAVLLGVVGCLCMVPYLCNALYISPYYLQMASVMDIPAVNPLNIDYSEVLFWNAPYLLTHLSGAIKMVLRTIQENTGLYLVQMVGGKLGEYILRDFSIWTPLIGVCYGALFFSVVPTEDEKPLLGLPQKCWTAVIVLVTTAVLLLVCLTWTSLRDSTIWGFQGRYLIPILPLALLVIQPSGLVLKRNIERSIIFTVAIGNLIAVASVYQQVLSVWFND